MIYDIICKIKDFLDNSPALTSSFTQFVRILLPILSALILTGAVWSLFTLPKQKELFARIVSLSDRASYPITSWESLLGRSHTADVILPMAGISRLHATISRNEHDEWTIYDLNSKNGTYVNGHEVTDSMPLHYGDVIRLAGKKLEFCAVDESEKIAVYRKRKAVRPIPPWSSLLLLTILQICLCIQLTIEKNAEAAHSIIPVFAAYTLLMWLYFIVMRFFRVRGFELEIIAFYLTSVCLSVTTSCNWTLLKKQLLSVVLGMVLMLLFGLILRDLSKVPKYRWCMAGMALLLMLSTLLLGSLKYGATNWIHIGSFSFQPSELAKLCYIYAGAATLDRLFRKRNLWLFIILSFVLMVCLALMNDFGTASVFFFTFLVISFLRSGDFATLLLFSGGAVSAGVLVLTAKPYIWARFSTWRHAMEYASAGGYQQARTLTAIASGGMLGTGPGGGYLKRVAAADTDLVFGMVCEEWGLITGILTVLCILALSAFAIYSCRMCRSSFYTIAACSATTMIVFQTALNVFGCTDLLPLTGVTFPFVSNGGSSMLLSWGLLAFLKAADTRPGASFVFRKADIRQNRLSKRAGSVVATVPLDSAESGEEGGDDE